MAKIETLIEDMQAVLRHEVLGTLRDTSIEAKAAMGAKIANHFGNMLTPREGKRTPGKVWFSQLGTPCLRKEYYTYNRPEFAEPISPDTRFKFVYGNVVEELTLQLAKAAGHDVHSEQMKVEIPLTGDYDRWSITGRIDAIIDGRTVDVKSMSTYSFNAMTPELQDYDDPFGYRWQLSGYNAVLTASQKPALLCVDKQLGHMKLSTDLFPMDMSLIEAKAKSIVDAAFSTGASVPARIPLIPMGTSGNMKLSTPCSYCAYKKICWPGVRTFLYSGKPVFLAVVKSEPKVPELHA